MSAPAPPRHAADGKRVALVIGNAAYETRPLRNSVNDANDMAQTLADLGFRVVKATDQDRQGMRKAVLEFGRALEGAEVGLFYYSGHGMQIDGKNYLIPLEVEAHNGAEMKVEAVEVGDVLARLEGAGTEVNLVILDACRDNPYRSWSRSGAGGLAPMDAPQGTMIAYATAPGSTAADGEGVRQILVQLDLHRRTSVRSGSCSSS